jgi:hypothetical protein
MGELHIQKKLYIVLIQTFFGSTGETIVTSSNSRPIATCQPCFWPMADLPGINADDCRRLDELGLGTTRLFIGQSRSPEDQAGLAQKLQLHPHHIQKWRALASLAVVPSVGCEYAGLLLHAGVASVGQLGNLVPGQLYRQVLRLQVAVFRRRDRCPNAAVVDLWIQQAKQLRALKL